MKPYSLDLREKLVERYEAGGISRRELARRFRVSLFFVEKILKLRRSGQTLTPKQPGGGPQPKLTDRMRAFVREQIERENDLSLPELCEPVRERFGAQVSPPFATKKKTLRAAERETERVKALRCQWKAEQQVQLKRRRVWFIDRMGVGRALTRAYARALGGARAVGSVAEKLRRVGDFSRSNERARHHSRAGSARSN